MSWRRCLKVSSSNINIIQVLEWTWWNKLYLIRLSGWQVTFKWAGQAVLCCIWRTMPVYEVERWEAILPSEDGFLFNVSPVCDLILWKFTLLAADEHETRELCIARQLLLGQPLPLLSLVHSQNGCYQLVEGLISIIVCNNELWTSYLLRNAWEIQRCWFLKISTIPDLRKSQGEICNKLSKASYLYDQSASPLTLLMTPLELVSMALNLMRGIPQN